MRLLRKRKNEIVIPKSWADITIGQYEDIVKAQKNEEQDENYLRVWANIIAAATNKQPSQILAQPKVLIDQWIKDLDWLSDTHGEKFINEIEINGTTYVVNPDISKITADQFIYLSKILKVEETRQRAKLCALFVWRKGESFKAENYSAIVEELYDHCPCSVLMPLSNFFFRLSQLCAPVIKKHLESKVKLHTQELEAMTQEVSRELEILTRNK